MGRPRDIMKDSLAQTPAAVGSFASARAVVSQRAGWDLASLTEVIAISLVLAKDST